MIRAAEQIPTKRNGNAFLEAEERVCALERAFASGISGSLTPFRMKNSV